jgi:hypothetical protein
LSSLVVPLSWNPMLFFISRWIIFKSPAGMTKAGWWRYAKPYRSWWPQ